MTSRPRILLPRLPLPPSAPPPQTSPGDDTAWIGYEAALPWIRLPLAAAAEPLPAPRLE